jgi:hypothetical protein
MTDKDSPTTNKPETSGPDPERQQKAKEVFERGILERGEAAAADENGKLPPGVTHEIVGHDAAGRPILKRRRFSAF